MGAFRTESPHGWAWFSIYTAALITNVRCKLFCIGQQAIFAIQTTAFNALYHIHGNKSTACRCISSATCCGISPTRSVVSHQAAGNTAYGWWYTPYGDDIHAKAWWYTKPAAWIKKEVTFGRQKLLLFWCRWPGSNRYGYRYPLDFKSRASASSATPA